MPICAGKMRLVARNDISKSLGVYNLKKRLHGASFLVACKCLLVSAGGVELYVNGGKCNKVVKLM